MNYPNAVDVFGFNKIYSSTFGKKKVFALTDLSLSVPAGTIFGLLGPNGAGKTTLIKLLLGITFPDSGSARILNEDISNVKIKSKIGYLPENHKYPSYLTGGETLKFFGQMSGLFGSPLDKKIDELLDLMNLSKWKKSKVRTYSKGMMQRLGIAQAMINDPELIFLDEPTDGVDPIGRKEIRDVLVELKNQHKTIFLNSHILSEVELITDNVGILNKGKLLKQGTVKELTEKKEEYRLSLEGQLNNDFLIGIPGLEKNKDDYYNLKVADTPELNKVIDSIRSHNMLIREIIPVKNTLEEMFISLIQEANKEEKR
ncbi:MAG: ABC transporter ATP-binding protein [Ignavibacteriaceae bacterium]|nr:ABC transporter ATP-binding protein [Ignavibacteriaceae bacterium]